MSGLTASPYARLGGWIREVSRCRPSGTAADWEEKREMLRNLATPPRLQTRPDRKPANPATLESGANVERAGHDVISLFAAYACFSVLSPVLVLH